jgi:hypothetical protein
MGMTRLEDVAAQIQKFWAPIFRDELKEATLLPGLVNKDYQGQIKKGGDTVRVSQIIRPKAQRKKIGEGSDTFETTKLQTQYIDIVVDQRISAAYEFEDLVEIQSQIEAQDSKVRQSLMEALEIEANDYLYSLVSPSTSSPDHTITGVGDFNASQLIALRKLAGAAKWPKMDGWFCLCDPSYYGDLLSSQTLISSDYAPGEAPVIAGQIANKRYGFNILEDDSRSEDTALAFHPDFMHLVMGDPQVKISDLHSNKQYGYVMSVNVLVGAKLGIDGDIRHITVEN